MRLRTLNLHVCPATVSRSCRTVLFRKPYTLFLFFNHSIDNVFVIDNFFKIPVSISCVIAASHVFLAFSEIGLIIINALEVTGLIR